MSSNPLWTSCESMTSYRDGQIELWNLANTTGFSQIKTQTDKYETILARRAVNEDAGNAPAYIMIGEKVYRVRMFTGPRPTRSASPWYYWHVQVKRDTSIVSVSGPELRGLWVLWPKRRSEQARFMKCDV